MAHALQDGAYTDGGAPGDYQNTFLPGHGLARLQRFMKSTQLAGNDEQYASALALAANRLGIPTRVVLGAMPTQDGTVKGKDVHAWVEVRTRRRRVGADAADAPSCPTATRSRSSCSTKSEEKKTGAQVPPPAANNPPSVLQGPDQAQNATQLKNPPKDDQNPLDPSTWPDWLRYLLFLVVFPLLVLLLVYGSIRLAKWVRRRRRRTRGATGQHGSPEGGASSSTPRATCGCRCRSREPGSSRPVLSRSTSAATTREAEPDRRRCPHGRPHAGRVAALTSPQVTAPEAPSTGGGRREHSTGSALGLVPLAASANGHVFDVDEPTPDEVDAFWADVETARRRIRGEQGFWQKVRGDVSLRTFRDHLPDGAGPARLRRTSRSQRSSSRRPPRVGARRPRPASARPHPPRSGVDVGRRVSSMKLKFVLRSGDRETDLVATTDSATTVGDLAAHLAASDPHRSSASAAGGGRVDDAGPRRPGPARPRPARHRRRERPAVGHARHRQPGRARASSTVADPLRWR